MNYVASLSASMCESCGAECFPEQLSVDHSGLCIECGKDLQAALDAEAAEERAVLLDDELAEEARFDRLNAEPSNDYEPRWAFR